MDSYKNRYRGARPGVDYDVRNPTLQGLLPGRDLSKGEAGLYGFDKLTFRAFQKGRTMQQMIANRLNSGGTYAAAGAMWGNPGPGVRVTDSLGRSAMVSQAAADAFNSKSRGASPATIQRSMEKINQQKEIEPKILTASGTAVGGSAQGVKIKKSEASKSRNTKGTKSLGREARNATMKISNLNL